METMKKIVMSVMVTVLASSLVFSQKIDEERMERDLAVAENVLSTLLRQQFDKQRMFFPLEVKANYQPGYGVTFRLPADFTTPMVWSVGGEDNVVIWNNEGPGSYSYSYSNSDEREAEGIERRERERTTKATIKLKDKSMIKKGTDLDSIRDQYNDKVIEASKNFLADYGDLISQVTPEERLIITNQGEQPRMWVGKLVNAPKRTHLSIEATKGDLTQYKQGKLNSDQLMARIKVVNTESVDAVEPDLELLSSIFDRLYQADLARTYFMEDNIYYERLKDYGVVYYMQVYSSNQADFMRFSMPTLRLDDVDLETRNKKVKELYPAFEKELKENILEYGRTVRSLKDNEFLVFNVQLTKCDECGIPSTIEVSLKGSVLKEYSASKTDKATALGKFTIKKGPNQ